MGDLKANPFVQWVGGKSRLVHEIEPYYNQVSSTWSDGYSGRYYEPFIGGGALFFKLQPPISFLSDNNPELINCYIQIRDNVEFVIEGLKILAQLPTFNTKEMFLSMRAKNPVELSELSRAIRLLYLNKTCFNGLYRVNKQGLFNSSYGTAPNNLEQSFNYDNLRLCSKALKGKTIELGHYKTVVLKTIRRGDFIYLDPPYMPISDTSNFTGYTKEKFSYEDLKELLNFCNILNGIGAYFVMSNSKAEVLKELFNKFVIKSVEINRLISCKNESRVKTKEVIITNVS